MLITITKNTITLHNLDENSTYQRDKILVYIKGYATFQQKIYQNHEAAGQLYKNYKAQDNKIKDFNIFNGCFYAFIYDKEKEDLIVFNDRFSTVPLFYSQTDNTLIISDSFSELKNCLGNHTFDKLAITEMLCGRYTTTEKTIIREVKSLYPASCLLVSLPVSKKLTFCRYWYFSFKPVEKDEKEYREEFLSILEEVFDILSDFIQKNSYRAAIYLSGGYDSRLLANEFQKRLSEIYSVSYGEKDSRDLEYGTRIAYLLGFRSLSLKLHSSIYDKVLGSALNLRLIKNWNCRSDISTETLTPFLLLPHSNNDIFIPGHTGDMITGGHIPESWCSTDWNIDQMTDNLFRVHYSNFPFQLFKKPKIEIINSIKEEIKKDYISQEDTISFSQRWNMENRQSKFIINNMRIYDEAHCHWLLPLWDYKIVDFFLRLPLQYKVNQNFYIKTLNDYVFQSAIRIFNKKTVSPRTWDRVITLFSKIIKNKIIKPNSYRYPDYIEKRLFILIKNPDFRKRIIEVSDFLEIDSQALLSFLQRKGSLKYRLAKASLSKLLGALNIKNV